MKKLLILFIMLMSIVYCANCTAEKQSLLHSKDKTTSTIQHTQNLSTSAYHSDVPSWLLRSI